MAYQFTNEYVRKDTHTEFYADTQDGKTKGRQIGALRARFPGFVRREGTLSADGLTLTTHIIWNNTDASTAFRDAQANLVDAYRDAEDAYCLANQIEVTRGSGVLA